MSINSTLIQEIVTAQCYPARQDAFDSKLRHFLRVCFFPLTAEARTARNDLYAAELREAVDGRGPTESIPCPDCLYRFLKGQDRDERMLTAAGGVFTLPPLGQ